MRELDTMEKVRKILSAGLGEDYPDGEIVSEIATGYSEPGYLRDGVVAVFGNWNPRRWARDGEPALEKSERLAPRLGDALEHAGAELEWLDEWVMCSECYRAVRTKPNSYSWKPSFAWVNECEPVCAQCMLEDVVTYVEEGNYVNNASKAITWADSQDLISAGFERWKPGDEQNYQNGSHEGMDDDPKTILATILAADEDAEVVFLLDEASQFYVGFSAWTRVKEDDAEDSEDE